MNVTLEDIKRILRRDIEGKPFSLTIWGDRNIGEKLI